MTGFTDSRLNALLQLCAEEAPGFALKFKNESVPMRVLGTLMFFNPSFMTEYTTTIGRTVYFPSKQYVLDNQSIAFEILAHELVHMVDEKSDKAYKVKYLFPQILSLMALLSVFSFVSAWALLFLLFLLALLPLPAPWRKTTELRGYTMSLAMLHWTGDAIDNSTLDYYAKQFTGSAYYFMWPFKSAVMAELQRIATQVKTDAVLTDPLFVRVKAIATASA